MDDKVYKRDKRSPEPKSSTVSKLMSRIKGTDTKPELLFRKGLFTSGYRGYRLNYKKLPGKPDVVFNKKKLAIFIHGCYWHGCEACGWKPPKHNTAYWTNKIEKNRQRDQLKKEQLQQLGYKVLTIWEHEIKENMNDLIRRVGESLQ